jgi:hypothetical protein
MSTATKIITQKLNTNYFPCIYDLIRFDASDVLSGCSSLKRWSLYEGHLQSSWTHLINPSRNFEEVRWRSLFRSTYLGERCLSYNAPPTSRKRATDRWSLQHFLPRSSLFMVGKAQKSHGSRSELDSVFSLEKVDRWNPIRTSAIQSRSRPMRFLGFSNHENWVPRKEISKWSTVCSTFSRSGWSLLRGVLRKIDRHRASTKFRLGVIRWVHELCKRPSYKKKVSNRHCRAQLFQSQVLCDFFLSKSMNFGYSFIYQTN